MTKAKIETIELEKVEPSNGHVIAKENYNIVHEFIVTTLSNSKNQTLTLNDLLEQANQKMYKHFYEQTAWYMLHVKQHLQATGVLTIKMDRKRVQHVTLVRVMESNRVSNVFSMV